MKSFAVGTGVPSEMVDLTTPKQLSAFRHSFFQDELAIVGLPVYGGRLPKNIDDFFSGLHGAGAPAVAVVVYGNRDYDDSLLELKLKLQECEFDVRAAATFVGEHTVSSKRDRIANDSGPYFAFSSRLPVVYRPPQPGKMDSGSIPGIDIGCRIDCSGKNTQ